MTLREPQPGFDPGIDPRPLRRLDTDEDRRFWAAVDEAAREVETYPAWKCGVSILDEAGPAPARSER